MLNKLLFLLLCFQSFSIYALELNSSETRTHMIQLYTSEGCSSCPPADAWLSSWVDDSRTFTTVIPMAFHVDYWNGLGWIDRFSQAAFSQQQRELVRQGVLSQVYTPGFVVDNQEWRGWFAKNKLSLKSQPAPELTVRIDGKQLTADLSQQGQYVLHIAYLGMGLKNKITAGENRTRTLHHDFVVLSQYQFPGSNQWQLSLPEIPNSGQQRTAISIWITQADSLSAIQAVAAYLTE